MGTSKVLVGLKLSRRYTSFHFIMLYNLHMVYYVLSPLFCQGVSRRGLHKIFQCLYIMLYVLIYSNTAFQWYFLIRPFTIWLLLTFQLYFPCIAPPFSSSPSPHLPVLPDIHVPVILCFSKLVKLVYPLSPPGLHTCSSLYVEYFLSCLNSLLLLFSLKFSCHLLWEIIFELASINLLW